MNFLAFDCETTGLSPEKHAIIEIAMIPVINGVKKEPFVSKIKPHKEAVIDLKALEINKVNPEQLKTFPEPEIVINDLIEWIKSHNTVFNLLGHNVNFDRQFLKSLFTRNGRYSDYIAYIDPKEICTLDMAKQLKVKSKSNKLVDLCDYFKIELNNAHSALPDIEATYELYQFLRSMNYSDLMLQDEKLTYSEKRAKYLGVAYSQFTPEGVFLNQKALKDPRAVRFLVEEIYRVYGG